MNWQSLSWLISAMQIPLRVSAEAITNLKMDRAITVLLCALYVSIIFLYYPLTNEWFGASLGYPLRDIQAVYAWYASLIAAAPAIWLPIKAGRVSVVILWFVYFFYYVPSVIVCQFVLRMDLDAVLLWQVILLFSFSFVSIAVYLPPLHLRRLRCSWLVYRIGFLALAAIVITVLLANFGFTGELAGLETVYEKREEYRSQLDSDLNRFVGYLVVLVEFWLVPLLLAIGIRQGKREQRMSRTFYFAMAIVASLYIFYVAAFKSAILGPLMVLATWMLLQNKEQFAVRLVLSLVLMWTLFFLLYWGLDLGFPFQHIARRAFVTPGVNASYYWEYFSAHQKLFGIGTSFLGKTVELQAPFVVGGAYYGDFAASANAGFVSDAFANAGIHGIAIIALLTFIALWLSDSMSKHLPLEITGSVFAMQAYALSNSGLFTVLVTYGLIATTLSMYFMPARREEVTCP